VTDKQTSSASIKLHPVIFSSLRSIRYFDTKHQPDRHNSMHKTTYYAELSAFCYDMKCA